MQRTDIEWTDLSANPLKYRRPDGSTAWACVKVSPGCANCYSEAIGNRFGRAETFNVANTSKLTPFMDPKELREMMTRRTCQGLQVDGSRCFVGDMTDLFGPWVPFELLDQLFAVMALRRRATFQILTKRPERAAEYSERIAEEPHLIGMALGDMLDGDWIHGPGRQFRKQIEQQINVWHGFEPDEEAYGFETVDPPWPLPNVWLGTSVENQQAADERVPHLLRCPGAVRYLSCEPLLGPIDLSRWMEPLQELLVCQKCGEEFADGEADHNGLHAYCGGQGDPNGTVGGSVINWVIAGGESGPNARPSHPDWFRSLRDQCKAAGVPFLFKQWGEWVPSSCCPPCPDTGIYSWPWARQTDPTGITGDTTMMVRVGKKSAGRVLGGREWNQFPEVVRA